MIGLCRRNAANRHVADELSLPFIFLLIKKESFLTREVLKAIEMIGGKRDKEKNNSFIQA